MKTLMQVTQQKNPRMIYEIHNLIYLEFIWRKLHSWYLELD